MAVGLELGLYQLRVCAPPRGVRPLDDDEVALHLEVLEVRHPVPVEPGASGALRRGGTAARVGRLSVGYLSECRPVIVLEIARAAVAAAAVVIAYQCLSPLLLPSPSVARPRPAPTAS